MTGHGSAGPIVHGGGIASAAARYGGAPQEWLDLSTGINPCPVMLPPIPAGVWHRLPDLDLFDAARAAAGQFYGIDAKLALPLPVPGTQAVIQLLPRLVPPSRRVAILAPTYGEYERVFRGEGFAVDLVSDPGDIGPHHGAAVLVNPNNPTGRIFSREAVMALWRRMHAQGGLLIVDEAFADTIPAISVAPMAASSPGLIVLKSIGKTFGLAGLRLGFVVADAACLDRLSGWLGPWAVSGPALSIGAHILRQDVRPLLAAIARRKIALGAVLDAAGLSTGGGTDLFTLVLHGEAHDLHAALCRGHILTRIFDYAPDFLRIGLPANAQEDQRLADALARWKRTA